MDSQHGSGGAFAVQTVGLTKVFGDQRALDGVDLDLRRGTVTALIGENGSGKSTLIKCLTGVYQPERRDQLRWGDGTDASSCVAVHQDLGLVTGLTVAENFALGMGFERGLLGRIAWRRHNRRVAELMREAGVDVSPTRKIEDLSLAERTLVAIARALGQSDERVTLAILDEPTAALPLDERNEVMQIVRRLASSGLAVLYVSHHLEEIVEIADDVVVLRAGSIAHQVKNDGLTVDGLVEMMSGSAARHTTRNSAAGGVEVLSVSGLSTGVLRDVDFTVKEGEVLGIHGALDAGGSQICRALAGLVPYTGTVRVDGRLVEPRSVRSSTRRGVFLVPGDRRREGIIADLTVGENLSLSAMRRRFLLAPLSRRGIRTAVASTLEVMDIRPRDPSRKVGMLSGGNQQKVVIARALDEKPRVLVLENPTQGVDPAARAQIREQIRLAAASGMSVVVSDVDDAEVYAVADRVIELGDGGGIQEGAAA